MKKLIRWLALPIRKYFGHEKIIYSTHMQPGKYQFTYRYKGFRLVRIAFTNMVKYEGMVPMTDLNFDDITAVKQLPSKFQRHLAKLFKSYKPKAIITHFNQPAETNGK